MAGAGILNTPLLEQLRQFALDEGFIEAGGVDLNLAWPIYQDHVRHYDEWLARGNAGEMHYLVRGRDRRADPRLVFPETQSIFVALLPYRKAPAGQIDPSKGPRYARYLDGADYHERVADRLERVVAGVATANPDAGLRWKVCVDTSAVLERTWAALSGLGWIGKNTLLIHPKHGSYTFIGVVLLNASLDAGPRLLPDFCGNCTRCLASCPTKAIEAPHSVDSRKCIAYWTLEKRGELELSPEQKKAIGTWVAGCDLCQEACPFNAKPTRAAALDPTLDREPQEGAICSSTWRELDNESEPDYRARIRGSALSRVKPEMFRRNLEIARENAESPAES
jgi:epoxyqueuosine reductase